MHYIVFTIYVVRIVALAYDVCDLLHVCVCVCVSVCGVCVNAYARLYVYNSYKLGYTMSFLSLLQRIARQNSRYNIIKIII